MWELLLSPLCQPTGFKPTHAYWSEITDQVPGSSELQRANLPPLQWALQPQVPHLAPDAGPQHGVLSPQGPPAPFSDAPATMARAPPCRALLREASARKGELKQLQIPALQYRHSWTLGLEGPSKPCHVPPLRSSVPAAPIALVAQQKGCVLSSLQKSMSPHFWLSISLGSWTFPAFWVLLPPTAGCCKTSQGPGVQTQGQGVRSDQGRAAEVRGKLWLTPWAGLSFPVCGVHWGGWVCRHRQEAPRGSPCQQPALDAAWGG